MNSKIFKSALIRILSVLTLATVSQAMTLDQAITIGRERSLRQLAPKIEMSRVEGQITEAWSNALPQVDALASYQRAFEAPVMFFPIDSVNVMKIETQQKNTGYGEVTLTQPIYTFGRINAGLKAAFATRRSNEYMASQAQKSLDLDIVKGFWSVLLLQEVVTVRREALSVAEGALEKVTQLRNVGLLSDFEVMRARSQVSALVPDVIQAENDGKLALLALLEVLGLPLDTAVVLEGSLNDYSIPAEEVSMERALARDDLSALREGVAAYEEIYKIYKNAGMPSIGAQLKYSWQWGEEDFEVSSSNSASALTGGIALNIPVWNSGKVSGKAQQIRADVRKMRLDLANAERGVQLQVSAAKSSLQTAKMKLESAGIALNEASQARRIAETQLENGQVTPLDLQTAQLNETAAKLGLANAKFNLLTANADLKLAIGQSPY